MREFLRILSIVTAVVLFTAGQAMAGTLPTDPFAIPAWRGTQNYSDAFDAATLKAAVDYAVFAPGQFNNSFPGADPSSGAQFVYAYQIFNDQGGNQSLINLNVGFSGGNELPANIGELSAVLGQLTSSKEFIPAGNPKTAAMWDFAAANVLAVGAHSTILIYTSPKGPEFDNASIQGGSSLGDQQLLPSPVPEPATWILAAVGMVGLFLSRLVRRANS